MPQKRKTPPKKPPHKKKKKKAETPDEDLALWRRVAETVEPLAPSDILPEVFDEPFRPGGDDLATPSSLAKAKRTTTWTPSLKRPAPPPIQPLPDLKHGDQPGLDKATARRMKRGQVSIEGRIDLHGLTQGEAHRALGAFLEASWLAGKREVLVITGKGTRKDGSIGVLRQMVPRWLNEFPNRAKVVAFSHAAPKDGGEGALYVRLKKRG